MTEISYCKLVRDKHMSRSALIELARSVLDQNAIFRFRAGGGSMSPFIRNNDLITLAPVDSKAFRRGDIVAFVHPHMKQLVVHRIVGACKNRFRLKGDNTSTEDGLISKNIIIGRVVDVQSHPLRKHFTLGAGRVLIAFLSRKNLLVFTVYLFRSVYHLLTLHNNWTGRSHDKAN